MDKIKWETVTYTIAELKPAGGVVTQRDVLEKYKTEHPDEEVKTFSGFKYDYQSKTVSLRIGIADPTIAADSGTIAKIEPGLLQSEHDELVALKEKYDALYIVHEELKVELEQTRIALFADEDSADLAEAKKAIAEGSGISLDEVEDTVGDKEPVTVIAQVNGAEIKIDAAIAIKKACDQAEVVGPDDDTVSEDDKDE